MRRIAGFALLLSLAMLWGCTRTVLVPVPPRMDLRSYGTLGIVEFASNSDSAINTRATREFQAHIHSAQPGTPFVELGSREAVLAAVGGRQLDAGALRKIGEKYGVNAIFVGDISSRLVETRTGATVWSSSAWATRQVGRVSVSPEGGVSGAIRSSNPREDMVPALVYHLTQDFRPGSVRQRVK